MAGVSIRIDGSDEVNARLAEAEARLESPRPMYDEIGAMLTVSTQARFEREEDPDGNPWPPSIRVLTEGGKTLSDTRLLFNSLTHEADDDGAAIGTNLIYAAIHQFGGTIRAKNAPFLRFRVAGNDDLLKKKSVEIPQRAFLGLDADDEKAIHQIAGDWMTGPLGGADAR